MVSGTPMVGIIQPFAILTCQLFVSKRTSLATNVCASSQTGRFFYHGIYVPCHETMPSFMFFGWLFYLLGFKNWDSHCFRRWQVCNSFSFLKRDLNMHPMTHVWISFRPQRWDVPYRNHQASCENLWFVRSIFPNLPQMGQKIYHGMLILLHDWMPCFMFFGWVFDLLGFKNRDSQCFRMTTSL